MNLNCLEGGGIQSESDQINRAHRLHIEIRFPVFLNAAVQISEKGDVYRAIWLGFKWHPGFIGGSASFSYVTAITCRNQVFPAVAPSSAFGHHMVEGKIGFNTTILAGVMVSLHHISSGEYNSGIGQADVPSQANNGGIGILFVNRADHFIGSIMQKLCLFQKNQLN